MKTVEQIRTSTESNKSELYLNLSKSIAAKANEIADENKFIQRKMKEEVLLSFRKCESADCEYTSYINAHATEIWFSKLEGVISGKLTMRDLL